MRSTCCRQQATSSHSAAGSYDAPFTPQNPQNTASRRPQAGRYALIKGSKHAHPAHIQAPPALD